jgi:hypothetical protein
MKKNKIYNKSHLPQPHLPTLPQPLLANAQTPRHNKQTLLIPRPQILLQSLLNIIQYQIILLYQLICVIVLLRIVGGEVFLDEATHEGLPLAEIVLDVAVGQGLQALLLELFVLA